MAAVVGLALAGPARAEPVDLELILAVDGSSSISRDEFTLQMDGLAQAFRHPGVIGALAGGPRGVIAVTLVQWSDDDNQRVAIPWRAVADAAGAEALARMIETTPRYVRGGTAIGRLIRRAIRMFDDNGFEGDRTVIDISGDGRASQGPPPAVMRDLAVARGITINGLPILSTEPDIERYYLEQVIGGPDSFVIPAQGFADFAAAIVAKLIREIRPEPRFSGLRILTGSGSCT